MFNLPSVAADICEHSLDEVEPGSYRLGQSGTIFEREREINGRLEPSFFLWSSTKKESLRKLKLRYRLAIRKRQEKE